MSNRTNYNELSWRATLAMTVALIIGGGAVIGACIYWMKSIQDAPKDKASQSAPAGPAIFASRNAVFMKLLV